MNKGYKILSVVACALLTLGMTSCEKEMSGTDGHHYPILFTCDDIDTRALDISTELDLKTNGFHVWGFYRAGTPNDNNQIEGGNFFKFDGHVEHNEGLYGFVNMTEYWWVADYYFAAMYPDPYLAVNADNGISLTVDVDPDTYELSGELIYENITKQVDLIYTETAAASRNVGGVVGPVNNAGTLISTSVPLKFKHLLSKINIQIKSEIMTTIQSVTLNDISKGATTSGAISSTLLWTPLGEYIDYEYLCNGGNGIMLTLSDNATNVTDDGILVIPGEQQGFTITVTTDGKEYTSEVIEANWEMGHEYTYTATLKQQNIIFAEPEVAVWDRESATGSVIIK